MDAKENHNKGEKILEGKYNISQELIKQGKSTPKTKSKTLKVQVEELKNETINLNNTIDKKLQTIEGMLQQNNKKLTTIIQGNSPAKVFDFFKKKEEEKSDPIPFKWRGKNNKNIIGICIIIAALFFIFYGFYGK
jgi:hypothetical protein